MDKDNFLTNQLKQTVEAQKNLVNFLTENLNSTLEAGQKQQVTAIKEALKKAVDSGQLNEEVSSKILAWYNQVLSTNNELTQLSKEHLVKSIDEFFKADKASPQTFIQNYADYITKVSQASFSSYSQNMQSAQEFFSKAFASVQEKTQKATAAVEAVVKKSRK